MFDIKEPNKRTKSLLAELGSPYSIKVIDLENCLYRVSDDGKYDVEISGVNSGKRTLTIYLWERTNMNIVDRRDNVEPTAAAIRQTVDELFASVAE